MKILKRSNHGYQQDPTKYLGFEQFDGLGCVDSALVVAAFDQAAGLWSQFDLHAEDIKQIRKLNVIRLEFEEPNKFFIGEDFDSYDSDFHKVLTLCPYTSDYLNSVQNIKRRQPIFFPFNEKYIPHPTEKCFDVIYTGHLHPVPVRRDIKIISKFDYRLVSNSKDPLVTNQSVDYETKLDLISKSRVTLTHNLLYPTYKHVRNIWTYPSWRKNLAFSDVPCTQFDFLKNKLLGLKIQVPQIKSRVFEAAFCRSLILCKWDKFNVIERFFEPNKEFVYYKDGELQKTLHDVLVNYESYLPVVENAYGKARKNYTTSKFFDDYLNDD